MNSFSYKSYTDSVLKDMDKAENAARVKAARHIADKMKEKLSVKHVSLPGQAPGKQSGDLVKGITTDNMKAHRKTLVGVKAPAHHAHLMEFGTAERIVKKTGRKVGRVLPRPFLGPTFEEEADTVREILSEAWV